ncbi:MAG TPA: dihydrolipoamide acetyltransferase family protein [Roseiflexaceae bacterium]|nr:dihydrolipoamide acetyltransferase family protein [Roseiflexaceae bacterium]HMP42443.1 dihydrolipoamide acetyltransferase family protein [Roseiflexaceae bacterium]
MADITMPKMGFDMQEGTIVRWLKKPGDDIKRGEPIAEIETDKVTIEIEAFDSGTLSEIVVKEGETAAVNSVIARLANGDAPAASPAAAAPAEKPAAPVAAAEQPAEKPADTDSSAAGDIKASPLARRMARENNLDLRGISGSGPGGRVVKEDVEAALAAGTAKQPAAAAAPVAEKPAAAAAPVAEKPAASPAVAAPAAELVPLSNMRKTIARRTAQSWQQAPHFMITMDIDMGPALELRKTINAGLPKESQIGVNDMIIKACAQALQAYPVLNASYTDSGIELHPQVNISIAVALDSGLVAPVITNCHERSLGAISRESKRLVAMAREGKLGSENLQGGTFTISNLGMYGVSEFVAIITLPQAAILAVAGIQRIPVFKEDSDEVVARQVMKITLSADHRVTDGAEGAKFVGEIKRQLEQPLNLLVG